MTTKERRLLPLFTPAHYTLHINLTGLTERHFLGEVTVRGTVAKSSRAITLHAKELQITSASIDGQPAEWRLEPEHDEITLLATEDLTPGEHKLTITYSGTITDPMHGIYPCYFTLNGHKKELIATQFESHHAREAFPCIDEPAAKAVFDLTLTTTTGITTLSNTPITSQHAVDGNLVTTFGTTPRMSTYLLAFVTGELAYTEATSGNGVTVRGYSTPDKVEQTRYATEHAARTLDFYDEYFNLPYPLEKCDIIALPDFSTGAMENWGLITFRESCMLVDEQNTAADTKQFIAGVVCHELAHQWFGNLVTMQWWDDLWLNESFANWMEHAVVDHFYPDWQVWEQYNATSQQSAFTRDALASVQAVQQHVAHPDEIRSLFDPAIVYAKGGCLIRMLNEYLGTEVFREGLRLYMERHQYGNTHAGDLWAALSEVSGQDVAAFMEPWVRQPGHPVVNFNHSGDHAKLTQNRFYANPTKIPEHDDTLWPVPVLSEALPDLSLFKDAQATTVVKHQPNVLLNEGGTGFYHVQYDAKSLGAIAKNIETLQTGDRQRLLLDSLALTRAGHQATTNTLDLMAHYKNEASYSVWLAITAIIGALKIMVNDDPALKPHLKRYVGELAQHEFTRLGWERKKGETYFDELMRPLALGCMAYAEQPEVIAHGLHLLRGAEKPEDIPTDIRSIVYGIGVYHEGKPVLDRLLTWYDQTPSAEERINLTAGISNMQDTTLVPDILNLLTTKKIKLQDIGYWFAYLIRNAKAKDQTWAWMKDSWPWIHRNFSNDMHYTDFARYSAGGFSTAEHLAAYKDFFTPKLKEPALKRTIEQGLEDIEIRKLWRERDLRAIKEFLTMEK